ncbi:MAG TPA: HAD-IIIC family phosphatase [Streptosporangiaceae bacterium]
MSKPAADNYQRYRLADALAARQAQLIQAWEKLGQYGPTGGASESGPAALARDRYLHPLARALVGALSGAPDHAALYFDERLRYADRATSRAALSTSLSQNMAIEFAAIAELVADVFPADRVRQDLWDFHAPLLAPPEPASKVLFIGDCLFVETRAFLIHHGAQSGHPVDVRHVFFGARPPAAAVNTAIVNEVTRYQPDLIGLSLFTFAGVPPYASAWRRAALPLVGWRAAAAVDGLVGIVSETIADIRTVSDRTIALHVPCGVPLDGARRRLTALPAHSRGQRRLLTALSRWLTELADATENVLLVSEAVVAAGLGGVRAAAAHAFADDDVPPGYAHTTALGPALAVHYRDILRDYQILGRAKALLVDFDNTLWQGVMAEGAVGHDTTGQELLRELKNAGVLLVALSKNDERSIRWDEMVLSADDFVLAKINWRPKPENVAAAIAELDLGADAFVLLDDNPAERALVTGMIPGVAALDPADPGTWRALRRWLAFPSTGRTEEARRRTQMYREAAGRRAELSEPLDYATVMKSLALRYQVRPATEADLPRMMALIERTSQFNTTTLRHTVAEVRALLDSAASRLFVASLRDRFGRLGIVAMAVFDQAERRFDSVIMSCRAMGFGLEFALLRAVMDAAGPGPFLGRFIPTDRNGPAAGLFEQAGFHPEGDGADGGWVLPARSVGPLPPPWLTRE